jgi:hypothetical protein
LHAAVLVIFVLIRFAQIGYAIVAGVLIDVIYVFARHSAVAVQPCQSMRFVQRAVQAYDDIAVFVGAASNAAFWRPIGSLYVPAKFACAGVIRQ